VNFEWFASVALCLCGKDFLTLDPRLSPLGASSGQAETIGGEMGFI